MRVLHVLAESLPSRNGYTLRSHYILRTQRQEGSYEPYAATSPFYRSTAAPDDECGADGSTYRRVPHPADAAGPMPPADRFCRAVYLARRKLTAAVRGVEATRPDRRRHTAEAASVGGSSAGELERPASAFWRLGERTVGRWLLNLEELLLMRRFRRELLRIAVEDGADLVHAHSPFRCALPALSAARALGLPAVYEIRGLWEESGVAIGEMPAGGSRYRRWRRLETRALRQADAVVCLSQALREEIVARGVPRSQTFVAYNGVDTELFRAPDPGAGGELAASMPPPVETLRVRLAATTIGYAGSLRRLEGLDLLLRGVSEVVRRGHDACALIVGSGPELPHLQRLAGELGLEGRAHFPGAVAQAEVVGYYGLIDIFAITRPDLPVNRKVSPLKPVEAMAMAKAVVVPDLPALRELVADGETGVVVPPGDVGRFADACVRLIEDRRLRQRLGANARRWVCEHRTWPRALAALPEAYRAACRNAVDRSAAARSREA